MNNWISLQKVLLNIMKLQYGSGFCLSCVFVTDAHIAQAALNFYVAENSLEWVSLLSLLSSTGTTGMYYYFQDNMGDQTVCEEDNINLMRSLLEK